MSADVCAGVKGKSFYLHEVKKHQTVTLTDIISRLGGKVDSFLNKDVNVVVTGVKEALCDFLADSQSTGPGGKHCGTTKPLVCGSRGKALLEKVIHNNEKCKGSVLANARSWGVKIVNVDQFLKFIAHLNQKRKTAENKGSKGSAPRVKAGVLRGPYLKVEDSSRKYRPSYSQTLNFPTMSYSGIFSPFEPPIPQQPDRSKEQEANKDNLRKKEEQSRSHDKLLAPLSPNLTPRGPTKKSTGFCECCHMPYKDQNEHLQSEMHRTFVQNDSNYAVVDQLTASMHASFVSNPKEVDPTLMKSLAGCSQSPLTHLTEMEQHADDHLPPITDLDTQDLDNKGHDLESYQCPPVLSNVASDLYTLQNSSHSVLDHDSNQDKLDVYIKKLRDPVLMYTTPLQSNVLHMELLPHDVSSEAQSIEKTLKSLASIVPSEIQVLTPSSLREDYTVSGGACLPQTPRPSQDLCEAGHGGLVFHIPKSLTEASPNTVSFKNQKQDRDEDLKMCSNTPRLLLKGGEDDISERHGLLVLEHKTLPSVKDSLKSALDRFGTAKGGVSYFSLPHPLPLPHLSDYPLSIVNLRKRCRSFNPRRKFAKRRRISQRPSEKSNPSWDFNAPCLRHYSSVFSNISCLPIFKVGITTEMSNPTGGGILQTQEHSMVNQIPVWPSLTCASAGHFLPYQVDQLSNVETQPCDHVEPSHQWPPFTDPLESQVTTNPSSDSGPPRLFPFFHEDYRLQQHQDHDPPQLFPYFVETPEDTSQMSVSKASNSSVLSGASVCIESGLLPNLNCSMASSESDWDSGLLSWLATAGPLQAKGGRDELGLLLQKPYTGMQDGNYTSHLCSVLQPS
ncbi:uncharacterized protein dbf4b [Myxocyprinus asiaticus]|uniref:uncharacterized protein dbf4b n=1 Tax=Myxocyprinus asiaticus TaxID=70543 RepID=UPI002223E23C|nr:uncharacterized protein dbf4b [Myxocyprinus asiaticus]